MAEYTVFGAITPVLTDLDDSDSYALGTVVLIAEAGNIIRARWFFPDTAPTAPIVWRVSDLDTLDLLGSHTFAGDGPGWVEEVLDPPIAIAGARNVLVWIGTPEAYVATTQFFTTGAGSAGLTNGPLTAPNSAGDPEAVGNGRFGGDPSSPPLGTINGGAYFADLVFEDLPPQGQAAFTLDLAVAATGDAPAVPPNEGQAAFTLDLAVAATGDAPPVPPNEGVAELGIEYSLTGVGETPAPGPNEGQAAFSLELAIASNGNAPSEAPGQGQAAFSLALSLAAEGSAPAGGTAAFSLALALAATGDNGMLIPCSPVRSFAEVMPS